MPTNEERREIAKAIRKTAQQSFLGTRFFTPHSIERLLNLEVEGTFLGIDYYTVGSVLRLADLIEPEPITGETSDGYHTFNELYDHRARLFSVIVAAFPERAWKSKMHHDGTMYDGMFIVGIKTPDGQATYHYDIDPYWSMFRCKEIDRAPEWDGHTPEQAIERISHLADLIEPEPERMCLVKPWAVESDTGYCDCTECECGTINDVSVKYCSGCGGLIEVVCE